MTNAEALRALATVMAEDETAPYKALRLADPEGLAIALLRQSAAELDRMQASLTARDTDLMKEVEMYRARWLSNRPPFPAEQAQRMPCALACLAPRCVRLDATGEPCPVFAEQAQRKLNDDAWERNKDIREGTDRARAEYDPDGWRKAGE